jgi:hypothetical protein
MRAALAAVAVAALGLASLVVAAPATATGKVKCDVGTRNGADVTVARVALDPIVYHNVNPADTTVPQPHGHDFFGNRAVPANSPGGTYTDAMTGATTCRLSTDTAAYWAPALVYTSGPKMGERVPVQQFTAYYRGFAGQTVHAGSKAFPAGVRLVASDGAGYGLTGWTCGAMSSVTGGQDTIPDCSHEDGTAGNTLTAHVNFPSCWNGNLPNHPGDPGRELDVDTEQGDTRDNADFTYPTNKTACPSTHPIEVVQLREAVQYAYTGDGTDVALTSDHHDDAPGSTYHVDFWNTWQPGALEDFVQRCVQTPAESNCDL